MEFAKRLSRLILADAHDRHHLKEPSLALRFQLEQRLLHIYENLKISEPKTVDQIIETARVFLRQADQYRIQDRVQLRGEITPARFPLFVSLSTTSFFISCLLILELPTR